MVNSGLVLWLWPKGLGLGYVASEGVARLRNEMMWVESGKVSAGPPVRH